MSNIQVTLLKARLAGLYKEIGFLKEQLKKEMEKDEVKESYHSPEEFDKKNSWISSSQPSYPNIHQITKKESSPTLLEQVRSKDVKHRI